jgi:SAM-dependent methyltransferase
MKISEAGKKKILDFYRTSYNKRLGGNAEKVGWSSGHGQAVRFEVLDRVGDLDNASILDVGSGLGDFYGYLEKYHKNFHYLGIDLMPEFTIKAQIRFPNAVFKNIELTDIEGNFDYVVCSGALNTKIPDYKDTYFSMIEKMYSLSKIASAFNFLDIRHHDNDSDFAAFHPKDILEFCRSFAHKAVLVDGYIKWDATIFLYH